MNKYYVEVEIVTDLKLRKGNIYGYLKNLGYVTVTEFVSYEEKADINVSDS